MLLYNEQSELLSPQEVSAFALELEHLENTDIPDEEELEADLEGYYAQADMIEKRSYGLEKYALQEMRPSGKSIFERIRQFICRFLSDGSTASDIIDKILEAISAIIPGGIIIKWIVKKLVKFILNAGYAALCPII